MNMKSKTQLPTTAWLLLLLVVYVVLLVLDFFWITVVVGPLYHAHFPNLIKLSLWPACVFYILFGFGLFYFSLYKNFDKSFYVILFDALLFGVNVYSGYALTLLAVFDFWRLDLTILEVFWGGLLSTIVVTVLTPVLNYLSSMR